MKTPLKQIQTKPQHYDLLEVRNNSVTGPLALAQYSRCRPANLFSKKLLRLCLMSCQKIFSVCFKLGITVLNFSTFFSSVNGVLLYFIWDYDRGTVTDSTFSYLVVLAVEWPCSGSHHCLRTRTFHSFIAKAFEYK